MKLRNLRIYALPDGKELIADALHHDGVSLYPVNSWGNFGPNAYHVREDGRLIRGSQPTPWSVEQLKDTGREAQYPRARLL